MKRLLAAAACLLLAACAAAPRGPAPLDPVGTFAFQTQVQGSPMTGTIVVAGAPGAYTGTVRSDMMPEMPVTGVSVEGQEMTVRVSTGDGEAEIHMVFTGDDFTGHWSMGADGGEVRGRRVRT